jgi:hypothetical protein
VSLHFRWRDVPLREVVDAIRAAAEANGGRCWCWISGPVLRIYMHDTREAGANDCSAGEYRVNESRVRMEEKLLGAFWAAVDE